MCLAVHRYSGLLIAAFLLVAALTGSIIAFARELDAWLNPELFQTATSGPALPIREIVERVEAKDRRLQVEGVFAFPRAAGEAIVFYVVPRRGAPSPQGERLNVNQLFADPVTGDILGKRLRGACCLERQHLIPFVRIVHWSLFAGFWGQMFMGGVAIVWLLNCFVGLYLTLPPRPPFWRRWSQAWRVELHGGFHRANLDVHRASGLWLYAPIIVLAFSSVALGLHHQVMRPAVGAIATLSPDPAEQMRGRNQPAAGQKPQSIADILGLAEREAAARGWRFSPDHIFHFRGVGFYRVALDTPAGGYLLRHVLTYLYIDSRSGKIEITKVPGTGSVGDTILETQLPLHTGDIAGLPGRIVVCAAGLAISILCVSGVLLWWKRSSAR